MAYNDDARSRTRMMGAYVSVTPVNAIQFYMSSGNISTGIIRQYGYAK